MITKELLRAIRNDLPMKLTIFRLREHGPITKQIDGYFRFQCPLCGELRAGVNPKNNLAHCFSCEKNFNNIDLLRMQGHDFVPAVQILEGWLQQYQRDLNHPSEMVETTGRPAPSK